MITRPTPPRHPLRSLLVVIHCTRGPYGVRESVGAAVEGGADGVFLINQGADVASVLDYGREIRSLYPELWMGVNLLGYNPAGAIRVAGMCGDARDGAPVFNGMWVDECGASLPPEMRERWAAASTAAMQNARWAPVLFGGVAFKGGAPVPEDLLGSEVAAALETEGLCDVVTTSGTATGVPPSVEKIQIMGAAARSRGATLAVASGVTEENLHLFLPHADSFLVGTGVERSWGDVDAERVRRLSAIIAAYNRTLPGAP